MAPYDRVSIRDRVGVRIRPGPLLSDSPDLGDNDPIQSNSPIERTTNNIFNPQNSGNGPVIPKSKDEVKQFRVVP